ncbi:MAG: AI-2E family transporter [Actinomycetota bacterium]|nr:AI-2E family transporter [Actinomycetota bacterium]
MAAAQGVEINDSPERDGEFPDADADGEVPPPEEADPRLGPPSPPWSPQTKIAVAVGLVVFAAIVFWFSRGALAILAMSGIVAFLVAPMVRTLHRRFRWPRWLALALGYLVVLIVSLLLIAILAVGITQSLAGIDIAGMENTMRGVAQWFVDEAEGLVIFGIGIDMTEITEPIKSWLSDDAASGGVSGGIKIDADALQGLLGDAFNSIRTVTGLLTAMVMSALITMMIAIYLNADSAKFYEWIHRAVPPGYERDAAMLSDRIGGVWRGYIYGQLINSLITGIMLFIVLAVVGVQGAFLMGVIMMLFNMIPTFGPIIAAFPGVIAALVGGSTRWPDMNNFFFALIVAGIYVVVVQAQANIIAPKVMGRAVRLSPVIIMISLIVGFNIAGLIGSLLAVPIVASIKEVVSYLYAKVMDREPFSNGNGNGIETTGV